MSPETENSQDDSNNLNPAENPHPHPVKSLFEVFPRPLVIAIGLVACLCFCVIVYFGAFHSSLFYDRMARGWAIIGAGFCLGYFMYLAFPQNIEITKIPILNVNFRPIMYQ